MLGRPGREYPSPQEGGRSEALKDVVQRAVFLSLSGSDFQNGCPVKRGKPAVFSSCGTGSKGPMPVYLHRCQELLLLMLLLCSLSTAQGLMVRVSDLNTSVAVYASLSTTPVLSSYSVFPGVPASLFPVGVMYHRVCASSGTFCVGFVGDDSYDICSKDGNYEPGQCVELTFRQTASSGIQLFLVGSSGVPYTVENLQMYAYTESGRWLNFIPLFEVPAEAESLSGSVTVLNPVLEVNVANAPYVHINGTVPVSVPDPLPVSVLGIVPVTGAVAVTGGVAVTGAVEVVGGPVVVTGAVTVTGGPVLMSIVETIDVNVVNTVEIAQPVAVSLNHSDPLPVFISSYSDGLIFEAIPSNIVPTWVSDYPAGPLDPAAAARAKNHNRAMHAANGNFAAALVSVCALCLSFYECICPRIEQISSSNATRAVEAAEHNALMHASNGNLDMPLLGQWQVPKRTATPVKPPVYEESVKTYNPFSILGLPEPEPIVQFFKDEKPILEKVLGANPKVLVPTEEGKVEVTRFAGGRARPVDCGDARARRAYEEGKAADVDTRRPMRMEFEAEVRAAQQHRTAFNDPEVCARYAGTYATTDEPEPKDREVIRAPPDRKRAAERKQARENKVRRIASTRKVRSWDTVTHDIVYANLDAQEIAAILFAWREDLIRDTNVSDFQLEFVSFRLNNIDIRSGEDVFPLLERLIASPDGYDAFLQKCNNKKAHARNGNTLQLASPPIFGRPDYRQLIGRTLDIRTDLEYSTEFQMSILPVDFVQYNASTTPSVGRDSIVTHIPAADDASRRGVLFHPSMPTFEVYAISKQGALVLSQTTASDPVSVNDNAFFPGVNRDQRTVRMFMRSTDPTHGSPLLQLALNATLSLRRFLQNAELMANSGFVAAPLPGHANAGGANGLLNRRDAHTYAGGTNMFSAQGYLCIDAISMPVAPGVEALVYPDLWARKFPGGEGLALWLYLMMDTSWDVTHAPGNAHLMPVLDWTLSSALIVATRRYALFVPRLVGGVLANSQPSCVSVGGTYAYGTAAPGVYGATLDYSHPGQATLFSLVDFVISFRTWWTPTLLCSAYRFFVSMYQLNDAEVDNSMVLTAGASTATMTSKVYTAGTLNAAHILDTLVGRLPPVAAANQTPPPTTVEIPASDVGIVNILGLGLVYRSVPASDVEFVTPHSIPALMVGLARSLNAAADWFETIIGYAPRNLSTLGDNFYAHKCFVPGTAGSIGYWNRCTPSLASHCKAGFALIEDWNWGYGISTVCSRDFLQSGGASKFVPLTSHWMVSKHYGFPLPAYLDNAAPISFASMQKPVSWETVPVQVAAGVAMPRDKRYLTAASKDEFHMTDWNLQSDIWNIALTICVGFVSNGVLQFDTEYVVPSFTGGVFLPFITRAFMDPRVYPTWYRDGYLVPVLADIVAYQTWVRTISPTMVLALAGPVPEIVPVSTLTPDNDFLKLVLPPVSSAGSSVVPEQTNSNDQAPTSSGAEFD